jgi:Ca2+-binding RTX toxin-like protein
MSVSFDNGILTISGTAGDDSIQVGSTETGYVYLYDNSGPLQFEGGLTQLPSLAQVRGVIIRGGDGNDLLQSSNLPTTLLGGAGDDTLVGGTAADYLAGGAGEDLLLAQPPRGFGSFGQTTFGGRLVGPDTLWGEGQGDTLLGEGADDGFQGQPRDGMSLTVHNGVLRIRGTLDGCTVLLRGTTNGPSGDALISAITFDRAADHGLSNGYFATDIHAVELCGIAPEDVTIDDAFAALNIPVRYVTAWTQATPTPIPDDAASGNPAADASDLSDTSTDANSTGAVTQPPQLSEPQPAYAFNSPAVADSLLKSDQQLWNE